MRVVRFLDTSSKSIKNFIHHCIYYNLWPNSVNYRAGFTAQHVNYFILQEIIIKLQHEPYNSLYKLRFFIYISPATVLQYHIQILYMYNVSSIFHYSTPSRMTDI